MMKTARKYWGLKITGAILVLLTFAMVVIYYNLNRIITQSLHNAFNNSAVSDVYELKFEDLSVNFLAGSIKVFNVVMQPLAKPLRDYPYINSTFRLTTKKVELEHVNVILLLKSGSLQLEKIGINQPEIELYMNDKLPIFFPFNDSLVTVKQGDKKKFISAFLLKEFSLTDATVSTKNTDAKREFKVTKLNISLHELFIDQHPGMDIFTNKHFDFSIGESNGKLLKDALKYVKIKDFKLKIDSIQIQRTKDTLMYHFGDFSSESGAIDIQTQDSIYHTALGTFNISYKNKSIKLTDLIFKPNVSNNTISNKYKFQHTQFSGTVGTLSLNNINFDSIIYQHKLFIDEIVLDKVSVAIYKDKTKPMDMNRFPKYFGEQIMSIPLPMLIKQVNATNINLVNTERKPDSSFAKVNVNRGTLHGKNITNISPKNLLVMNADAFIENKAHAYLTLGFDYLKPQFSMDGKVKSFNLPDINGLIQSYTPAQITKGTADEISFSGMVYKTNATGTFKFLYHDLAVDLHLKNKAQWKSSVLAFAANQVVNSANPASTDEPPRIVQYDAQRDMNKGFFNIIIRSILSGFKETMYMSKENRMTHKASKKKFKEEHKK